MNLLLRFRSQVAPLMVPGLTEAMLATTLKLAHQLIAMVVTTGMVTVVITVVTLAVAMATGATDGSGGN